MAAQRQDDFTRTNRNRLSKLDRTLRDADIWALRARGHSVMQIAESQELSPATVRASLLRVAEEYKVESAAEIIKMELDRLDIMLVHAMHALEGEYVAWSNGRMMRDDDDEPVPDIGPVMKAIDTILKIMDRRSKYLGLDAPTKSEQSINVHKDPNEVDLAVLNLIDQFNKSAHSLSPADLALPQTQPQPQPQLPSQPQHPTITLPTDHFTDTTNNMPTPAHQPDPVPLSVKDLEDFGRAVEERDTYE